MILRPITPADREAVRALIHSSALPVGDFDTSPITFIVAIDCGGIAGVVGLEAHGDVGLLRSLAVRAGTRGAGLGGRLVDAMEMQAGVSGLRQLALLTTTAAPFFARRGYTVVARDALPHAIQRSAEFSALCPASATCMTTMIKPTP